MIPPLLAATTKHELREADLMPWRDGLAGDKPGQDCR